MRIIRCILSVGVVCVVVSLTNNNRSEHIDCQHLPNAGINLLLPGIEVRMTLASASRLTPKV